MRVVVALLAMQAVLAADPTELPSDCGQKIATRGMGTQNYLCHNNSWVLEEPVATLHYYSAEGAINPKVIGYHNFDKPGRNGSAGGAPSWRFGADCNLTACGTTTDSFTGTAPKKLVVPNAIAWLLVQKLDSTGTELATASWVQRLNTVRGDPTTKCTAANEGQKLNVPYECDYIFGFCGADMTTSIVYAPVGPSIMSRDYPDAVNPVGSQQKVFTRGVGTQNYICGDAAGTATPAWVLVEPVAWLHAYSDDCTSFSPDIAGYHHFASPGDATTAGGAPAWTLGAGCQNDACNSTTATFSGKNPVKYSNGENIDLLLVQRNQATGELDHAYLQRLDTIGGKPPPICTQDNVGKTWSAAYECDYIFTDASSTGTGNDPSSAMNNIASSAMNNIATLPFNLVVLAGLVCLVM